MDSTDLEERLINFSVLIIEIANGIPNTLTGSNLAKQIGKSGTACALNYGEAKGGESMKDFIHKMQIVLKELRETFICLKILNKAKLVKSDNNLVKAMKENNELISIFVKSVNTSKRKLKSNC